MPDTVNASILRGKNTVITGGLGLIGSRLAGQLVELGAKVLLVDNLKSEQGGAVHNIEAIKDRVQVNICDVRDQGSLRYLLSGQDYLFNLAGPTSHIDSMTHPLEDLDINCRAQLALLDTVRTSNPDIRIVFASTRQVYGRPQYLPVDEAHPVQPVDVNGINKVAGEAYHSLYHEVYGIKTTTLRLTNTYGPHMRIRDARQIFLGSWVRSVLDGETFEVWGGDQVRDFTYVDDAAAAFIAAAVCPDTIGGIYNVGGLEVVSLKEVAEALVRAAGNAKYAIKPFPTGRLSIDIGDYHTNDEQFRSTTGWVPKVTLEVGLSRTMTYYREHAAHYR